MNQELRRKKLNEIEKEGNPYMTGIRIKYENEMKEFSAFRIPLKYLIYNKYNGRIGSLVKSFEKQYRELDMEKEEDTKRIEDYLWRSKENRNKLTLKSLVEDGQQRYGIVTNDGIIIDGNRRACLLNKIYNDRDSHKEDVDHCQYFMAVILPKDTSKREILKLETSYQMGEDEKLDYNAIEKYIKCSDLMVEGFSTGDISKMMGESKKQIEEWISIFERMKKYLDHLGYDGIYTSLNKREGQFVDLNNYLKKYEAKQQNANWSYEDDDIGDLETICFDYIRAQYEGKDFRNIAKTGRDDNSSIFCNKKIWEPFVNQHFEKLEQIHEESPDEFRKKHPDYELTRLYEERDKNWKKNTHDILENNLRHYSRKLDDIRESREPLKLLKKAKDCLEFIDTDVETFYSDKKALELVNEINTMTYNFKKIIKKGKNN